MIAARAGISTAAARQALIAHEKNGTATRVKGSRPGIADTWTPAAAPEAPRDEAPPAEAPGAGSTADDGQPVAEPAGSTAGASQPAPAPAGGTAEDQQTEAGSEPGPDPAVTAEAAGSVAAIAQAAGEAGKALAAGNLDAALAALETARDLAAHGRRVLKAAASGRRAPATRSGALRGLVEEHLRTFPGTAFTPHQIGKVLTRSAGAVANAPHMPGAARRGARPRAGLLLLAAGTVPGKSVSSAISGPERAADGNRGTRTVHRYYFDLPATLRFRELIDEYGRMRRLEG